MAVGLSDDFRRLRTDFEDKEAVRKYVNKYYIYPAQSRLGHVVVMRNAAHMTSCDRTTVSGACKQHYNERCSKIACRAIGAVLSEPGQDERTVVVACGSIDIGKAIVTLSSARVIIVRRCYDAEQNSDKQ